MLGVDIFAPKLLELLDLEVLLIVLFAELFD